MANPEHLAILKQGAVAWKDWRKGHPDIQPELGEADLHSADLSRTNLSGADLRNARLGGANLSWSDLSGADLRGADLSEARLISTNLSGASLRWAIMNGAFLYKTILLDTDLTGAILIGATLRQVHLSGATLQDAQMWETVLIALDLSLAKGLETVQHMGPSNIGIETIYQSQGGIPENFLRGIGVQEKFIDFIRSPVNQPIDYHSCFISYSSEDEEFVRKLYNDLRTATVRCWFAPEDIRIGDNFWERIEESIRQHDKLLVILSEHSIESTWVENEVMRALEKERQQPGQKVLCPIRVDDTELTMSHPWVANIRLKRHIGDFSRWKDQDAYQQAFERLLRDLTLRGFEGGGGSR